MNVTHSERIPMTDRQAFLETELAALYRVSQVLSCSLDLR